MTARVNGIDVDTESAPSPEFAVVRELLRQQAVAVGLLERTMDDVDAINTGIEQLLVREIVVPTPTEAECRLYYEAHRAEFRNDDLVHARHILFQVTPQANVPELRGRAEHLLNELLATPDLFTERAREVSNCPSGRNGGNLGQLKRGDTVPEFERALFRIAPTGIVPELIRTRFGFHIVSIDQSISGIELPFEFVREEVSIHLRIKMDEHAVRQYVSILAGKAKIEGIELEAAVTPLVQ